VRLNAGEYGTVETAEKTIAEADRENSLSYRRFKRSGATRSFNRYMETWNAKNRVVEICLGEGKPSVIGLK
jgi:hypothetical protein